MKQELIPPVRQHNYQPRYGSRHYCVCCQKLIETGQQLYVAKHPHRGVSKLLHISCAGIYHSRMSWLETLYWMGYDYLTQTRRVPAFRLVQLADILSPPVTRLECRGNNFRVKVPGRGPNAGSWIGGFQ